VFLQFVRAIQLPGATYELFKIDIFDLSGKSVSRYQSAEKTDPAKIIR